MTNANYINNTYKYDDIYNDLQNDIFSSRLMCMKEYLKKMDALIDAYTKIKKETTNLTKEYMYWRKTFRLIELAEHRMGISKFKKQIQIKLKKLTN